MMTYLPGTGRFLLWFLSLSIAIVSLRFLVLGMDAAFPTLNTDLEPRRLIFTVHVIAGPIALLLMPLQFVGRLRRRFARLHRYVGRSYGAAILLGGTSGFYIAVTTDAGPVVATGFALLALAWMAATGIGIWHARSRRIAAHRRWMIRSAALTFAGVTLRLWLAIGIVAGLPFGLVYPLAAWMCWLINLAVVELWLRRRQPSDQTGALTA